VKKAGGAAQAVGLLLSVASATRLYPEQVSYCRDCDGPITKCTACGRWHCDDDGCMPVDCARALEEQPDEAHDPVHHQE
jgi:hypothetical protein